MMKNMVFAGAIVAALMASVDMVAMDGDHRRGEGEREAVEKVAANFTGNRFIDGVVGGVAARTVSWVAHRYIPEATEKSSIGLGVVAGVLIGLATGNGNARNFTKYLSGYVVTHAASYIWLRPSEKDNLAHLKAKLAKRRAERALERELAEEEEQSQSAE